VTDSVTEFPARSLAVMLAFEPSLDTTSLIDQSPFSSMCAVYGPEETSAPGSEVPSNVTTRSLTVAPSDGDVMCRSGGVVSLGTVVTVVLGAGAVFGATVVVGSSVEDVVTSGSPTVTVEGAASGVDGEEVSARRASALDTRRARIAEATLADTGLVGASTASVLLSSPASTALGENAANPTTATRATISSPAYASGIGRLTRPRESCSSVS
jgi:hypothetical protein